MIEREKVVRIYNAAIAAVQPARLLQEHLSIEGDTLTIAGQSFPRPSFQNIYVIGAGKAVAAMAAETEKIAGPLIAGGMVTTKYGHSLPLKHITIKEAAHPVPDQQGVEAVAETLALLKQVTKDDIVICLISGGASALWCDVPAGITLSDLQTVFDQLLRPGASIHEMNTVRKHLSGIKGGQLLRHCGQARVVSLIISDVPGDNPDVIASGPTVADASTFHDAHQVLTRYDIWDQLPAGIRTHIKKGMQGAIAETPKPGDPLFYNTLNKIIGSNQVALRAAARTATSLGYHTYVVPRLITGRVEEEARKLVELVVEHKGERPVCILQGGETSVKVTGKGKGGRNQHFALTALQQLSQLGREGEGIIIASGGTDGTDGPTNAAGAMVDKDTLARAGSLQLNIATYMLEQDAYHFLQQTGGLLITGATQTNVMDIMMAIVP